MVVQLVENGNLVVNIREIGKKWKVECGGIEGDCELSVVESGLL